MGAGTQVLTNVGWIVIFGTPGEFTRAMLMAAAWVINLAIAQWIIRRGGDDRRAVDRTRVPEISGHSA